MIDGFLEARSIDFHESSIKNILYYYNLVKLVIFTYLGIKRID